MRIDGQGIYHFLEETSIQYDRYDHAPVYTSEQAKQIKPPIPGASTKNLFLRDKKGTQHYLLVFDDEKSLEIKSLARSLGISKLSLASPERLMQFLGITPGAVSLLALVNDKDHNVSLLIDQSVWEQPEIQCHPLVNTSTLVISREGIQKLLEKTGHAVKLVDLSSCGG